MCVKWIKKNISFLKAEVYVLTAGKNELVKGKKVCASCYDARYKSISKIMHMSKVDKRCEDWN